MQMWPTIASFFSKIYGLMFTCSMLLTQVTEQQALSLTKFIDGMDWGPMMPPQRAACKTHRNSSARNTWVESITSSWRRPIFRKSYDCDYIYVYCYWLMYTFSWFMWYVGYSQMNSGASSSEAEGYLFWNILEVIIPRGAGETKPDGWQLEQTGRQGWGAHICPRSLDWGGLCWGKW